MSVTIPTYVGTRANDWSEGAFIEFDRNSYSNRWSSAKIWIGANFGNEGTMDIYVDKKFLFSAFVDWYVRPDIYVDLTELANKKITDLGLLKGKIFLEVKSLSGRSPFVDVKEKPISLKEEILEPIGIEILPTETPTETETPITQNIALDSSILVLAFIAILLLQ